MVDALPREVTARHCSLRNLNIGKIMKKLILQIMNNVIITTGY